MEVNAQVTPNLVFKLSFVLPTFSECLLGARCTGILPLNQRACGLWDTC